MASTNKAPMELPPCSPENSILENDLELAVLQQTLKQLTIAETLEGFYVIAKLQWTGNKDWYLTTRRERERPRLFKDLRRLNEHLKTAYPTDRVEILRNQKMPDPVVGKGPKKIAKKAHL